MKESLRILDIQALLDDYIDFDFIDQLSAPKRKRDQHYYTTYLGILRDEYAVMAPDMTALVIKEIMKEQAENYKKISAIWNPYLETVYGVLPAGSFYITLNEFIRKPSSLQYTTQTLCEQHNLSLEDYICQFGCLTELEALIFAMQLCEGLETLCRLHIVHGDLSPQNIMLTDRFPLTDCPYPKIPGIHHTVAMKIIDFDIARKQKNQNHKVTVAEGTINYTAPETLDYKYPTDRADLYSLGCILCYMLTGNSPKESAPEKLSPRVRRIINKCTLDYAHRYRSATHLKKEILLVIELLSPSKFLHRIPGFRTENPLYIGIASYYYCAIGMSLPAALYTDFKQILTSVLLILIPVFGLDIFLLGNLFYPYASIRDQHPWIGVVIRILGVLLPILTASFLI